MFHIRHFIIILGLFFSFVAQASTQLTATRVIIFEENKEGSITVLGDPKYEFLIQSWVDAGLDPSVNKAPIPFAVAPNLVQLLPKQEQRIRILYQGSGLPTDRESVFFLNVQEVPQTVDKNNVLQLAVRQRMKVFYRPSVLGLEPNDAIQKASWVMQPSGQLTIKNPSPYHISFGAATLMKNNKKIADVSLDMLAPFQEKTMSLPASPSWNGVSLEFDVINDYGNALPFKISLQDYQPQTAIFIENP